MNEALKTGDEFREDGGRQVGGIVVVAEQDDHSIIDGNKRASNSDSCPCLRLCLSPSWGTYRRRGKHGTSEPWISEFCFDRENHGT